MDREVDIFTQYVDRPLDHIERVKIDHIDRELVHIDRKFVHIDKELVHIDG